MIPRLLAVVILTAALLLGSSTGRTDSVAVATPDEVRTMVEQGAKIVDIRRADEWRETGVIEGSILLTAIDAEGRLIPGFMPALANAVRRDEPVVVICRSGNRSALISRMMSEAGGYARVADAGGGIRAWLGAGQPLTPCASC